MSDRALIVVDLQNEYQPSGQLPLAELDRALTHAAQVLAKARERGDLIVHVWHESSDPAQGIFQPGTDAVSIIADVAPQAGEAMVCKHFPNSFRDTSLHATLQAAGVKSVTVIGAMSHMCIEATARAAADLGYAVTVVHDACATRALQFEAVTVPAAQVHAASMASLAFAYATLRSTAAYLQD